MPARKDKLTEGKRVGYRPKVGKRKKFEALQKGLFVSGFVCETIEEIEAALASFGCLVPVGMAALMVGVSRQAVYKAIWAGRVASVNIARQELVPLAWVREQQRERGRGGLAGGQSASDHRARGVKR